MKVPDKVYVKKEKNNVVYSLSIQYDNGGEKYIRKDTLLEWAKEVRDSGPIKDSADKGDAWSIGYLCGMRDIIDKLNSL